MLASMSTLESFSKLKKELHFHEKRMQLLLSTRILEELGHALEEMSLTRHDCAADCRSVLTRFEQGASDAQLTGRWDEMKIRNLLKLEVLSHCIVGGAKFEAPDEKDMASMRKMLVRLASLASKYPEFTETKCAPLLKGCTDQAQLTNPNVEELLQAMSKVQFSNRDFSRMTNSVQTKLKVLVELDDLTQVLHSSGFEIAKQRADLENVRKEEVKAVDAGEVAWLEEAQIQRMQGLEKIIDVIFFQAHTINSTIDTNASKRKSNLSAFQNASATLECLKSEKKEVAAGCERDAKKITRAMEYEDKAKSKGRTQLAEQLQASKERFAAVDKKQVMLTQRLKELHQEFAETEEALAQLGQERTRAVVEHIELVESNRHATSDFMELIKFCEVYRSNLMHTKEQYESGIEAITLLERILLQGETFDQYDFSASKRRLSDMQKKVCMQLRTTLKEYEGVARERVRRKKFQMKRLEEEIAAETAEMELRKEVLDPIAKKHVIRVRQLQDRLEQLESERQSIMDKTLQHRSAYAAAIGKHMDETLQLSDEDEDIRDIQQHEEIVDMRAAMLESEESMQNAATDETLRLLREKQQVAVAATVHQKAIRGARAQALKLSIEEARQLMARNDQESDSGVTNAAGDLTHGTGQDKLPLSADSPDQTPGTTQDNNGSKKIRRIVPDKPALEYDTTGKDSD